MLRVVHNILPTIVYYLIDDTISSWNMEHFFLKMIKPRFWLIMSVSLINCVVMKPQLILMIWVALVSNYIMAPNFDKLRESVSKEEQRAYIKVNVLLETAPRVVANQLALALPESHLSERTVYNWYNDFKDGRRTDIEDLPRSGRRRTTTDEETKEYVKELIMESEGMRTEDLLYETGIPKTSL